jgi:Ca-activated chloride channel homolog
VSYIAPGWLWLLGAVGSLAVLYVLLQVQRRTTFAVRFTNLELLDSVAPRRPGWRRHIVAVLFLASLATLVFALARPTRTEDAPLGPTLVLAIDVSLSMDATDVDPSRIEAAEEAATAMVDELGGNVQLGLVTFNGVASIRVAPTKEHDEVRDAIASLELGESTAIGEAIFASLDAIELGRANDTGGDDPPADGEVPSDQIVLMSDGETTVGRPNVDGAQAAFEAGVPVNTIAFGTDSGVIEIPEEPAPVPVPVNEQALEAVATATGGEFFAATTGAELAEAFADIGGTVDTETVEREITTWFLGLGIALLLVTSALSLLWFSRLP